jgi:hypothetical protein
MHGDFEKYAKDYVELLGMVEVYLVQKRVNFLRRGFVGIN